MKRGCSLPGSNWRPSDYETDALPTEPKELHPRHRPNKSPLSRTTPTHTTLNTLTTQTKNTHTNTHDIILQTNTLPHGHITPHRHSIIHSIHLHPHSPPSPVAQKTTNEVPALLYTTMRHVRVEIMCFLLLYLHEKR